ncbi:MAG: ribosome recycling factor [SAR86 cluster bacterium]|jgi:ribosome recycling factor|nr:ribosome recycling factor [SAR86 cluster bacterium]MDG1230391.1 ribosome recycling factor [SAR86 cluster bacterium]MDG1680938.1 ribosome recycling factor [SAR86 cluster bacterium]|tara:strand:+ start:1155 stop:1712 length:558 start_codon:yes stop_codon:yes gene_type:complete
MLNEIVEDAKIGMEKSLNALDVAFKKIRTGRATPSLLDSIKLDYYDKPTPLSQVASISIEDAKTLAIVPWEKGIVQQIEKTILESDLGLNPATSGDTIRVILPDLTEETRKEFIKKAKAESENAKVSIRNVRRDGNNQLKDFLKEKEISQDEERQGEEQIQKLTDLFVEKVDTALEAKEKDLLDF